MSKKHKNRGLQMGQQTGNTAVMQHQAEYSIIKMDLIKVIILNVVYLAVILGLYYANKSSHVVDTFFAKVLNF